MGAFHRITTVLYKVNKYSKYVAVPLHKGLITKKNNRKGGNYTVYSKAKKNHGRFSFGNII